MLSLALESGGDLNDHRYVRRFCNASDIYDPALVALVWELLVAPVLASCFTGSW